MDKKLEKNIKKGYWNFFIYYSPVSFPFNFAIHPRILTVSPNNEVHKYQIHSKINSNQNTKITNNNIGHIHIDDQEPLVGDNVYLLKQFPRYEGKMLFKITGKNGSIAHKMVSFLENQLINYPYKNSYKYIPGPNSNTFIQRIISHFPILNIKLPWNAFGKNYK